MTDSKDSQLIVSFVDCMYRSKSHRTGTRRLLEEERSFICQTQDSAQRIP